MSQQNQKQDRCQFMTFYIGEDLFGIEVVNVQEVTGHLPVESVPLAPSFVKGLINLRGQIATALDLKEMFGLKKLSEENHEQVSVVCSLDGNLVSLLVDSLGDVVESNPKNEERVPETVPLGVKKYLRKVCKREHELLSIVDLEKLNNELSLNLEH